MTKTMIIENGYATIAFAGGIGFVVGFTGVAAGFLCAFFGGQRLYDKGLLFGSALIACSCLLLALGVYVIGFYGGGP